MPIITYFQKAPESLQWTCSLIVIIDIIVIRDEMNLDIPKKIKSMYKNVLIQNCTEYCRNSLRWWCVRGERPARKLKVVCCEESNCDSPPSSKQVFPQPRKYFPTDSQREHWPPQENQNYEKFNIWTETKIYNIFPFINISILSNDVWITSR